MHKGISIIIMFRYSEELSSSRCFLLEGGGKTEVTGYPSPLSHSSPAVFDNYVNCCNHHVY